MVIFVVRLSLCVTFDLEVACFSSCEFVHVKDLREGRSNHSNNTLLSRLLGGQAYVDCCDSSLECARMSGIPVAEEHGFGDC